MAGINDRIIGVNSYQMSIREFGQLSKLRSTKKKKAPRNLQNF